MSNVVIESQSSGGQNSLFRGVSWMLAVGSAVGIVYKVLDYYFKTPSNNNTPKLVINDYGIEVVIDKEPSNTLLEYAKLDIDQDIDAIDNHAVVIMAKNRDASDEVIYEVNEVA